MIGKRLLSSKPVSLADIKEILKDRSERGEFTYEQGLTSEYVKKFSKISKSKSEKMLASCMEIEGVSEDLAVKLCDVLPQTMDRLKLLVPKGAKLGDDSMNRLLQLCKQYASD